MRMLNPSFPGAPWQVPDELVQDGPNHWTWTYRRVRVTPGGERVEEPSIDNNGPIAPDINPNNRTTFKCIENLEAVLTEGDIICGGDPGEPNTPVWAAERVGILDAAVRADRSVASTPMVTGFPIRQCGVGPRLDAVRSTRGTIAPRTRAGNGGLRKPSVRVQPWKRSRRG